MTKEEIITKVWKHFVLDKNLPGRLGAVFLVELRTAHDSAVGTVVRDGKKLEEGFLPQFKQKLEHLAHKWGLKVPGEQAC